MLIPAYQLSCSSPRIGGLLNGAAVVTEAPRGRDGGPAESLALRSVHARRRSARGLRGAAGALR